MLSEFSLHDKVALVTGATGLLGKEHCLALAESGAVVFAADLDVDKAKEFCESVPDLRLYPLSLDLRSGESIRRASQRILADFTAIDVLVNNGAMNDMVERRESSAAETAFEVYPEELFSAVLDVNVTGVFRCCQIIGSTMAERGKGSIINIASTYGVVAPDQSLYLRPDGSRTMFKSPAYPVSKAAVIMLTKYLAAYWGERRVRVNSLSPGGVENGQDDFFVGEYSRRTPLNRMADKGDYRGGLVFLASDASSYMTGANLIIDGGWTCR